MELTQQDYDARVQRAHAGIATDDDLRLIKLYEREGFEQTDKSLTPADVQNPPKDAGPADADTAGQPARSDEVAPGGAQTDKPGSKGGNADDGQGKPSGAEIRDEAGDSGTDVTSGFPTGRSTAARGKGRAADKS